jgi:hypothetical protein
MVIILIQHFIIICLSLLCLFKSILSLCSSKIYLPFIGKISGYAHVLILGTLRHSYIYISLTFSFLFFVKVGPLAAHYQVPLRHILLVRIFIPSCSEAKLISDFYMAINLNLLCYPELPV